MSDDVEAVVRKTFNSNREDATMFRERSNLPLGPARAINLIKCPRSSGG
jgi:hypothetical protein